MNFKESAYWTLYADIVNFHRKYAEVQESDMYWTAVVDASSALYEKYKTLPEKEFAKQLILTVLEELERIYRGKRKEVEK